MKKKTILYIHHGKGLGGAPLSLLYLIQGLDKSRYKPIVLFLHDSEVIELYKKNGIETIGPLNIMDFSHTAIYWFQWYHIHRILKNCYDTLKTIFYYAPYYYKIINPDIIHLNTSSLIGWGIAAKIKNIPVVWHIREPLAPGYLGIRKRLIKTIIQHCASKIVPICKSDGIPWRNSPKQVVIYNAVNTTLFNISNSLQERNVLLPDAQQPSILFLGGLSEQKGTLFLLQVFERVVAMLPTAHLVIAGYFNSGSTRAPFIKKHFSTTFRYYNETINLYKKLKNNITILGPTHNVPSLMRQAEIVVFPASVDHFARPIIEAGFMKKATIASDFPHLRELIIDNKTGFLIPYGDHANWQEKILLLLNNPTLRISFGEEAYQFCSNTFSLHQQINSIDSLYKALAQDSASSPP